MAPFHPVQPSQPRDILLQHGRPEHVVGALVVAAAEAVAEAAHPQARGGEVLKS